MAEGWYSNSVVYDKNKGGEIMYKSTPDSLVQFISGTTIAPLADIYWGKWGGPTLTGQTMTGSQILANLSGASGYVGLVSPGRLYNFPSTPTQMYFWWCIPNYANDGTNGDKIIRYVIQLGNSVPNYTSLKSSTTPYTNQQVNPTPTPAIYYAIVPINGIDYRVYRSNSAIAGGAALNQYVVSY